jgi:hypothetical protein
MQRDFKTAVVTRLQFALAELEVVSSLALCHGEPDLEEQIHTLRKRVRECIDALLQDCPPRPTT